MDNNNFQSLKTRNDNAYLFNVLEEQFILFSVEHTESQRPGVGLDASLHTPQVLLFTLDQRTHAQVSPDLILAVNTALNRYFISQGGYIIKVCHICNPGLCHRRSWAT